MSRFAVILAAGGLSSRFGRNKLLEMLAGRRVLDRSIHAFASRDDVSHVVIATSDADRLPRHEKLLVAPAGACRAASVREALLRVPDGVEFVAVHDAARPLVSQGLIDRTFAAARALGAVAPALPVALTIKRSAPTLPGRVIETVPREQLYALQTPQVMRRVELLDAFAKCVKPLAEVTDDLQLLELAGMATHLIAGEERNLKITTRLDIVVAEHWIGSDPAGDEPGR